MIAADQPLLLQPAHAAQAGGRGQADPSGQLDIRHAPIGLQLCQDLSIHGIQVGPSGASHGQSLRHGVSQRLNSIHSRYELKKIKPPLPAHPKRPKRLSDPLGGTI
jgi:hypothetical protein